MCYKCEKLGHSASEYAWKYSESDRASNVEKSYLFTEPLPDDEEANGAECISTKGNGVATVGASPRCVTKRT